MTERSAGKNGGLREVELSGVEGVRYVPTEHSGVGALVVAGSSGRVDAARAKLLGEHGALAESFRWFGGPGQHDGPWEIPLEMFVDRVALLKQECDRVIVLGLSFGAEAALLTGALSDDVDAVVAFAPSDVVWAGITAAGRVTSHWTLGGEPLAFVPFDDRWEPVGDPPAYADLYRQSRQRFATEAAAAVIPVERIRQVVLVAGGDDQVWPSVDHVEAIRRRREQHGLATVVVTEPLAGHRALLPGEPVVVAGANMRRGGTEEADRLLGSASWAEIQRLL